MVKNLPAKQKTAYEIDVCDWSSDVCSSDLDILECEVKGALGSITMNKASGGNGIPVELFQIL